MKKVFILALGLCFSQNIFAQETTTVTVVEKENTNDAKMDLYFAVGVNILSDYKINKNLKAAGMPEIGSATPEFTFGLNFGGQKWLTDVEASASYWKKDNNPLRSTAISSTVKFRGHYVPYRTEKFFISAGVDLSYMMNDFNFYNRNAEIDLNDLDPTTQTGHIQLKNNMLYVGPSVSIGFLQNKSTKLRLNFGYDIAAISGKWKSDYTDVNNSFRENGHDKFYIKLTIL